MEANSFDEFEILEKENQENDKLLAKSNKDIEVELQEMMERPAKRIMTWDPVPRRRGVIFFPVCLASCLAKAPKIQAR